MSENSIVLMIIIAAGLILAYLNFSKPLTSKEIEILATMRRNKAIRGYYDFNRLEYTVDLDFKKKMKPSGQMYAVNDQLWEFPAIMAALLKGKKHEWIIIGFEKGKRVNKMWTNKGMDNRGVNVPFTPEQIVDIANEDNCLTVLIAHNHPNSDPQKYDCSMASNQDKITAKRYADVLNTNGINLLEFVCERGQHYEYFLSVPDSFMPIAPYLKDIERNNGVSRGKNLDLRLELTGLHKNQGNQVTAINSKSTNASNLPMQIPAIIFAICLLFYPKALLFIVPVIFLVWITSGN